MLGLPMALQLILARTVLPGLDQPTPDRVLVQTLYTLIENQRLGMNAMFARFLILLSRISMLLPEFVLILSNWKKFLIALHARCLC